jgi:hypothetical protein
MVLSKLMSLGGKIPDIKHDKFLNVITRPCPGQLRAVSCAVVTFVRLQSTWDPHSGDSQRFRPNTIYWGGSSPLGPDM